MNLIIQLFIRNCECIHTVKDNKIHFQNLYRINLRKPRKFPKHLLKDQTRCTVLLIISVMCKQHIFVKASTEQAIKCISMCYNCVDIYITVVLTFIINSTITLMFLITRWFFTKYVHTLEHIIRYSKRYRLLRILTKVRNFVCTSGICASVSSIIFLNLAKSGILSHDSIFNSSVKNCSHAIFLAYL